MCNFEVGLEMLDNCIKIGLTCDADDAIINNYADDKVDRLSGCKSIINTSVCIAGKEVIELEDCVKCIVLQPIGLF